MTANKGVSVVIPVYNESQNIAELVDGITGVLRQDYEIIFVDDGSTDDTSVVIERLRKENNSIKLIRFGRNFGQSAAMDAGFKHVTYPVVVSMDGDLQNDPQDIPMLIQELDKGYDVVCGWRHDRHDPLSKKIPSGFANWIRKELTGEDIHDSGCSLRAYRKEVLEGLEVYGEMHRYIPALITFKGYSVGEVKVRHHPRAHGKTKYSTKRLFKGLLDLFFIKFWMDYSTRPLHLFGFLGLGQYALAGLIFIQQVVKALLVGYLIAGPLLILVVMLFITGTLSITLGLLGEIMVRIYYSNSKTRPYHIDKKLL